MQDDEVQAVDVVEPPVVVTPQAAAPAVLSLDPSDEEQALSDKKLSAEDNNILTAIPSAQEDVEEDPLVVATDSPTQTQQDVEKFLADEPLLASLEDHFTLPAASNLVRFRTRGNAARVYEAKGVQMIMEEVYDQEKDKSHITVRRLSDETAGVQFLRAIYSIVCALWTGFFFVFCLQVLLFLVLELAVESGATGINADVHVGPVIGVILAIIIFVHCFSEGLVIAGYYIVDSWTGHFLAKQFLFKKMNEVAIEWIFFTLFLLLPLTVMIVTLLARLDDWWDITAIVWFGCVLGFFCIFCFNIVYYEVKAAVDFCRNRSDTDGDHVLQVLKRCIMLRQVHNYSGKTKTLYLSRSYFSSTEDTEKTDKSHIFEHTRREKLGWWAYLTKRFPACLAKQYDEPVRLHTIEDVSDYRPFLTKNTWSLERIFCRPQNSRYIAIVHGPGALTKAQIRSSVICSLIGSVIIILLVTGFLVWFRIPGAFVAFVFFTACFVAWHSLKNTRDLAGIGKDLVDVKLDVREELKKFRFRSRKDGTDESRILAEEEAEQKAQDDIEKVEEQKQQLAVAKPTAVAPTGSSKVMWDQIGTHPSEGVYLVAEYNRVNETTAVFNWIMFVVEIGLCFIFPVATLAAINWNICIIFCFVASVSGIRHYINAAVIIKETGNMDLVGGHSKEEIWTRKNRLNDIVTGITASKSRGVWKAILGAGGFGFLAIFLGGIGANTDNTSPDAYTYLPDFYYPPQKADMRYPTCTLSQLQGGFGANSTLADFAFMASIAYNKEEVTQNSLDQWFGPDVAKNDQDTVDKFREEEDPENSAVFFRLFSFPKQSLALIAIRGTSNNWDMLADSQLWSAAALMQGLRAVLPAGEIWTPIFDQLVHWINTIQSESLEKVSFYRLTKKFADHLKSKTDEYDSVQVTGHSLGGGLAMITGAQAKIPAIGLSGPNALISGQSFDPEVTAEDLNTYTFNIIPNRDIVPKLDDVADQFQYIRCEAGTWDFIGCHGASRSLCEILYTCGTGNRPALCECHRKYGYPQPEPMPGSNKNFDDECPVE